MKTTFKAWALRSPVSGKLMDDYFLDKRWPMLFETRKQARQEGYCSEYRVVRVRVTVETVEKPKAVKRAR